MMVHIEDWSAKRRTIEFAINNLGFSYDKEFHTFSPICICSARSERECLCTHLPIEYWD